MQNIYRPFCFLSLLPKQVSTTKHYLHSIYVILEAGSRLELGWSSVVECSADKHTALISVSSIKKKNLEMT